MLFDVLWFENELCILFADTNLGKSILAVQIADSIYRGKPVPGFRIEAEMQEVLYLDFELSDKQFEARYSENYNNHYKFNDNLCRAEIYTDAEMPKEFKSFEDYLNHSLNEALENNRTKVLIIDNITYLSSETERAKEALPLMKYLKALKNKFGLSILVLAHTPKRDLTKPLTRNNLQGSKMLINFCDSAFTIGQRTDIYYGNGSKTKYEYDPNNFRLARLLSTCNNGDDILQDINYTYDPEGNITEIVDNAQENLYFSVAVIEPKSLYEYDALYRLLKATGREHNTLANLSNNDFVNTILRPEDGQNMRNYTQTYTYDEIGNILEMKSEGVWTRDYRYDFSVNNFLINHDFENTTPTYLYDLHGNMTKMPHLQELKWDFIDNLKEITLDTSGNKAYYVYDANGERVRKVVVKNNVIETRFYLGDYEYYTKTVNGVLNTETETLHINDDKEKVALVETFSNSVNSVNSTIRYQLTNHLGSASLELDETAEIISYEEYHPFGTTSYRSGRSETEVSLKRYKYVFKELDNERIILLRNAQAKKIFIDENFKQFAF